MSCRKSVSTRVTVCTGPEVDRRLHVLALEPQPVRVVVVPALEPVGQGRFFAVVILGTGRPGQRDRSQARQVRGQALRRGIGGSRRSTRRARCRAPRVGGCPPAGTVRRRSPAAPPARAAPRAGRPRPRRTRPAPPAPIILACSSSANCSGRRAVWTRWSSSASFATASSAWSKKRAIGLHPGGRQVAVLRGPGVAVDRELLAGGLEGVVHRVDVPADVRRGVAVEALQEVSHHRVDVDIRVPEQLGDEIPAQFGELAVQLAQPLLEHRRDAVPDEELDVRLQHAQVRKRADQVAELDHVVPEQDVVRELAPVLDVPDERGAPGILRDRPAPIALDAAEHDVHVRQRLAGAWAPSGSTGTPGSRCAWSGNSSATRLTNASSEPDGDPSALSMARQASHSQGT